MKKQSFFAGTLLLTISAIFSKILGAIYKIPLTKILGSLGNGIYYMIFPIYAFLLTFVSNSFVNALSQMVSREVAKGFYKKAQRTFCASLFLLFCLSVALSVILVLFSRQIARYQGLDSAYVCYFAISPAIIFVGLSSAFRGYFQGMQNMVPSSISQITTQIAKLSFGFALASLFAKRGAIYGTLGGIIGITISEGCSFLFFVVYYIVFKRKNKSLFLSKENPPQFFALVGKVFKSSIPFTLSSIILPLSMLVDSFLIVNLLKEGGFNKFFATELLGLNSGVVGTLISLPSTLSISICITIVPYITFALSKGDIKDVHTKATLAIKLSLIVAIPCVFVFCFFSKEVISLLYGFGSTYETSLSSSLLSLASINVLYLSILQISTSLLQSIGKPYVPVLSLLCALVLKVFCETIFVGSPYFNISGAVLANILCYMISSFINIIYLRRQIPLSSNIYRSVFAPVLSSVLMSAGIFLTLKMLSPLVSSSLAVILSFLSGVIVFFLLVFILGTFDKKERQLLFSFKRRRI